MNKEIKTITKAIVIIIMSIAILLILSSQVSADDVLYPVEWKSGEATFSVNEGGKDRKLYYELQNVNWNSFSNSNKSNFVIKWFGSDGKDIVDDSERNSSSYSGFFWCSPRAGIPTTTQFNIFCCEFDTDTGISYNSDKSYDVGEIVFIEPNLVKAYKNTNRYRDGEEFKIEGSNNEKWQKLLAAAYEAQSSKDTNVRVAEYFAHSQPFQDKDIGIDKMNLIQEKCEGGCNPINLSNYNDEVNEYEYAGVFVTYSAWGGSGQARRAFHVIRREKIQTINLNVTKRSNAVEDNKEITGAEFTVKFENIESADMKGYSNIKNGTEVKNVSAGKIIINEIQGNGGNSNIKITFTETKAPDNYKIKDAVTTVEIKQDCSQYRINGGDWKNTSNGATVGLSINNTPLITLGGTVWQDGQKGEKNAVGPDGKNNDGTFVDGVKVYLYNANGTYTGQSTTTKNGGKYSFNDVEKTNDGYYVVFEYNGIKYQETNGLRNATGGDSKASETSKDRTDFNNRFTTITAGQSNDETPLRYDYDNGKSTLQGINNNDGTNPNAGTTNKHFKIQAKTTTRKNTDKNINCGLVKKEFDLALGTDVNSAELKINDKTIKYDYAQIMNGEMNDLDLDKILDNKSSDTEGINYNLYLYTSDYNYRIQDYKMGITNEVNPETPEGDYTETEGNENTDRLKELEAYVTYSVILKNQTTYDATVEQFVYYYDAAYSPYNIVSTDKYDVSIDEANRKITFTSKNGGFKLTSPDYRVKIDLTFKVNKDNNGIVIKDNCTTAGEITKYSTTEGGLIDKDSAPDNANITIKDGTPVLGRYEDDTDEAKGLTISLKDESRTITGTVFEDLNRDGVSNDNKPVNDVIVQLIEIKKISGKYYEYIWQETRSGSNQVKTTARNGYPGETYQNSVTETGKYEFKDYIPGNYIIRYIYGDGTTYDLTDNVKKYNGQDYKSTIDANYNKAWYNKEEYTDGQSVARDNEARRLEVMAYSATIDKTNGEALERRSKEDLSNTWMCAETSRINVVIDADSTPTQKPTVLYGNMNFGLALRPQTNLVLEKHITGLKITPSGTGVQPIVDAKANISGIVNGTEVETQGVVTGLATIKSTRGNRGFWQVATDIEELTQGAQLEVEYTYVIRNDGEKDYLNEQLITAYQSNPSEYSQYLTGEQQGIVKTVKATMRDGSYAYSDTNKIGSYLGQWYYNGTKANTDKEVSSRIETLEEALNNDLTFDSETSGTDFKVSNTEGVEKTVYDTDGNTKSEKINTVVVNDKPTSFLTPKAGDTYTEETADYSKTITLRTILSATSGGELGANLPSHIAEVVKYSNAAGRRDMGAEPENLSYVHSDDTRMTLENSENEHDEFWGETIIITKPTGEDKLTPMQIAIITISSIAVIGVGIVLIKKFVLKK